MTYHGRFARLGCSTVVALEQIFAAAQILHPVVTGTTPDVAIVHSVKDVVVAQATKDFTEFARINDEIVAFVTEDNVFLVTAVDGVVAGTRFDYVGTGKVGDDVITRTALDQIGTVTTFDAVVTSPAKECIVADTADDRIATSCTANCDMVTTGVLQDPGSIQYQDVGAQLIRISDHQRSQVRITFRICGGTIARRIKLASLIDFQNVVRDRKDIQRQATSHIGATLDQRGERVRLQFGQHMNVGRTSKIVETIAILQAFDLALEDEVMRGTKIATERHSFFSQTAVPEVDVIKASSGETISIVTPLAHAKQEVHGVGWSRRRRTIAIGFTVSDGASTKLTNDRAGSCPAVGEGGYGIVSIADSSINTCERRVLSVGRDEVYQGCFMPHVIGIVRPVCVRHEPGILGFLEEHASGSIERWVTHISTTGNVDRTQIEWQSHQVIL